MSIFNVDISQIILGSIISIMAYETYVVMYPQRFKVL